MNNSKYHAAQFSISVDEALLKLSKDFGISIPGDDYVLIQLYLNKSIIGSMLEHSITELKEQNEKSIELYRLALADSEAVHSARFMKLLRCTLVLSSLSFFSLTAIAFFLFKGA